MYGLKHQQEKRSMDYFAGLDVSVKETSVCIVDDTGKIVREVKVASEPKSLLAALLTECPEARHMPVCANSLTLPEPLAQIHRHVFEFVKDHPLIPNLARY